MSYDVHVGGFDIHQEPPRAGGVKGIAMLRDSDETAIADARLMAAAPELAEALKAVLVMWHSKEPRKLDEALTWRANDETAAKMAQDALKKAGVL